MYGGLNNSAYKSAVYMGGVEQSEINKIDSGLPSVCCPFTYLWHEKCIFFQIHPDLSQCGSGTQHSALVLWVSNVKEEAQNQRQ